MDQKSLKNRLILTLPLFAIVVGISIWNFVDVHNFNLLWRWFAWSNQMLATVSLWVATAYLMKDGIGKWRSLLTAVPATFMNAVVVTYLLGEPNIALGRFIPMWVAYIVGGVVALGISGFYVLKTAFGIKNMKPDALPLEDK